MKKSTRHWPRAWSACACGLLAVSAQGAAPVGAPTLQPEATFQELMDSVVDPAADAIWESVSTTIDAQGMHERSPRSDAEWHELRRHGIQLLEAAHLIALPGRRVARGTHTVEDGSALDVRAIQGRLDAGHARLASMAGALREVARALVQAADQRDGEAVLEAGGALEEACEACHRAFWYPDPAPAR